MSAHTPGPWEHIGMGDIAGRESNGGTVDIASVYLREDSSKWMANARLIAAAPDLLVALEGMLGAWSMVCDANGWERDHIQQQKDAVAAIAKATGSQP